MLKMLFATFLIGLVVSAQSSSAGGPGIPSARSLQITGCQGPPCAQNDQCRSADDNNCGIGPLFCNGRSLWNSTGCLDLEIPSEPFPTNITITSSPSSAGAAIGGTIAGLALFGGFVIVRRKRMFEIRRKIPDSPWSVDEIANLERAYEFTKDFDSLCKAVPTKTPAQIAVRLKKMLQPRTLLARASMLLFSSRQSLAASLSRSTRAKNTPSIMQSSARYNNNMQGSAGYSMQRVAGLSMQQSAGYNMQNSAGYNMQNSSGYNMQNSAGYNMHSSTGINNMNMSIDNNRGSMFQTTPMTTSRFQENQGAPRGMFETFRQGSMAFFQAPVTYAGSFKIFGKSETHGSRELYTTNQALGHYNGQPTPFSSSPQPQGMGRGNFISNLRQGSMAFFRTVQAPVNFVGSFSLFGRGNQSAATSNMPQTMPVMPSMGQMGGPSQGNFAPMGSQMRYPSAQQNPYGSSSYTGMGANYSDPSSLQASNPMFGYSRRY